jgi:hypothetical protein
MLINVRAEADYRDSLSTAQQVNRKASKLREALGRAFASPTHRMLRV